LKKCSKCGVEQPLENFYKAKGGEDGHRNDCKACFAQRAKDWYAKPGNKEKAVTRVKKWQEENPERYQQQQAEWRDSGRKAQSDRKSHLKNTFGLTQEEYEAKLRWQRGVCLICQQPPAEGQMLDVDHDHETGRVRGLLCRNCNHGLGKFYENPFLLAAAAGYLIMWDDPEPKEFPRVRLAIGGEPREPREDRLAG